MISRGAREREAEIFQLLEKSYPNMPRALSAGVSTVRFEIEQPLPSNVPRK